MFLSSIMNSLVIVLFLSGMVAMIMLRTLHKDIARYNQVDQVKTLLSWSRSVYNVGLQQLFFIIIWIYDKEVQQIASFEKLEPENVKCRDVQALLLRRVTAVYWFYIRNCYENWWLSYVHLLINGVIKKLCQVHPISCLSGHDIFWRYDSVQPKKSLLFSFLSL